VQEYLKKLLSNKHSHCALLFTCCIHYIHNRGCHLYMIAKPHHVSHMMIAQQQLMLHHVALAGHHYVALALVVVAVILLAAIPLVPLLQYNRL
jgi:hypothetical protein